MATALSTELPGTDCVGRTVAGRFTLLRWLGGTEHSSVFLTELEPAHQAAIKLIPADQVDADACLAEWTAARSLSHPRLTRLLYAGRGDLDGRDLLYVVTEYADEVLSDLLRERPLTAAEAGEMLDPVLDALSWLHSRDLVHGHLKPSNIMVVGDQLKLSIDGLPAIADPGTGSPGSRSSSANYDAPETALGQISPAADVWSLGIVLVEALTQRPPLRDRSKDGEPVVPRSIPAPFSGLVQECLRVDPASRATLSGLKDSLAAARAAESADEAQLLPPRARVMIACMMLVMGGTIAAMVMGFHHRLWPSVLAQSMAQTSAPAARSQSSAAPIQSESSTPAAQPKSPAANTQPPPAAPAIETPAATPAPVEESPAPAAEPPSPPQATQSASPAPATVEESPAPTAQAHTGSVVKGAIASQALPDVPQHIIDDIQGHLRVRIDVQVDSVGSVSDATIDSPGPSQYFANKALATARSWKFTPAQLDGRAAVSTWILQFTFSDSGITVTPTETSP